MVAGSDDERSAALEAPDGDAPPSGRARRMFRRPPGLVFHALLFVQLLVVLHSWSSPGTQIVVVLMLFWPLMATAFVWSARLATFGWALVHDRAEGRAWRFLVAPIAGVIALALVYGSVPLRLRWLASRSDFERALELAPPPTKRTRSIAFEVPDRMGSYQVTMARRQGDAVIFYDIDGSGFFDDAGFAYLPTGPFPELSTGLFENPQFRSLGGHWYTWTASW